MGDEWARVEAEKLARRLLFEVRQGVVVVMIALVTVIGVVLITIKTTSIFVSGIQQ